MISRIFIIASGGLLCYSKSFVQKSGIDDDLVSGFLTAISNFAREIKGGDIRSLNFHNFNFVYAIQDDLDTMFIVVTNIEDDEEEATRKVELMKNEFVKRFRKQLEDWNGDIVQFEIFDEFVENNIFIPPKILLVGEDGVGKTTIMNLFPGETVLKLDDDLNEIIEKPINVSGLENLKQFMIREININELIEHSKIYRGLLDRIDVVCIVTNSGASNLGRTKRLFSQLKPKVKKADFYIIANFQDLKSSSFAPEKIEEAFGVKTFGFSAVKEDSKEKMFSIFTEILQKSILDELNKKMEAEKEEEPL